jgi:hypothetical protein
MQSQNDPLPVVPKAKTAWAKVALIALILEKIVQHVVVTAAFAFDWADIGSTVVVSPTVLIVLGAGAAVAFAVSLWGLVARRRWAVDLLIALALFDIVGEFVAQGRIGIHITVSFIVAVVLLILALLRRQHAQTSAT